MTIAQPEKIQSEDGRVEMRVAGSSPPEKLAGAIVKFVEEGKKVSLCAMGAGAVNQAVKGSIIARTICSSKGMDMYLIPGFVDQVADDEHKSAVQFYIKFR